MKHKITPEKTGEENSLPHCWSRECALSWMRSLCLLLSRPHAGKYHQPPTGHHTESDWNTCQANALRQTTFQQSVFALNIYSYCVFTTTFCSSSMTLQSLLFTLHLFTSFIHSVKLYSSSLCCAPPSVSYLPGDGEVVLSLAAGSYDQVALVQGLHHLLCLVETDIVEVGVGDHTLYIRWRDRQKVKNTL